MAKKQHIPLLSLKEAIALFRKEKGAPSNAYEWYRKSASQNNAVSLGETEVTVFKVGNTWWMRQADFDKAILKLRHEQNNLQKVTQDYENGILSKRQGEEIETTWGYYINYGKFHFVLSNEERVRKKSDGSWNCNVCRSPAELEHNKEECHSCRNWNGCGRDCTLSLVFCTKCNSRMRR